MVVVPATPDWQTEICRDSYPSWYLRDEKKRFCSAQASQSFVAGTGNDALFAFARRCDGF
jgi:hypothetical protein